MVFKLVEIINFYSLFIYKVFSKERESHTVAQTLESGPEGSNEHRGSICLARSSCRAARNE